MEKIKGFAHQLKRGFENVKNLTPEKRSSEKKVKNIDEA